MASLQLGKQATTLHHWFGIADGRCSVDTLADLFDNDDNFVSVKQRILSSDIIDEISMLSQRNFEMIELICCNVKQNRLYFGGVQVIRQNEPERAKAVKELCGSSPSDDTVQLLQSLNVRLEVPDDQLTRLYGTNFDACYTNEQMLENLDGDVHVFKAVDEGDRQLLLHSAAPKTLLLKEGAPVMLIKKLGGDLPIILSFAMTVHRAAMTVQRAQGQTIQNAEIDCASFFAPGQLGVAVDRAVSINGLSVRNFSLDAATLKHPESVHAIHFGS